MRECFFGSHSVPPTHENVLGVLSLIIYSLLLVISIKYIAIVMRADNQGEGGILALTALLPQRPENRAAGSVLVLMGIFGAALLYGDGMITPAITVLGAVEGLKVATPLFDPYVVPVAVVILIAVFAIQRHGTHRVGRLFGPIMVIWFVVIAGSGIMWIDPRSRSCSRPSIRATQSRSSANTAWHGFAVLGAVFLVVTGGEALYADMGHFGKRPIRVAWFALVLPALAPELLRPGCAAPDESVRGGAAVLPARAGLGAPAARRACDGRRDHRVAGPDLGRVLADAAGHSTRLLSPPRHRAHVASRDRPGLRAAGELGADAQHDPDRHRLRIVDRAGRRVRHRGDADDGDHRRAAAASSRPNAGAGRQSSPTR